MLLMHKGRGSKKKSKFRVQFLSFKRAPSQWELWDCGYMSPHSSTSDSWRDRILCSALQARPLQRRIQESSQIQQDQLPPLHLFRVSPFKSFRPVHFLSLTESFSLTSLKKTRLRSSLASRAICATIWPAGPITIFCRNKKHGNIRYQWIDGAMGFISQQDKWPLLSNAGLKDKFRLKRSVWKVLSWYL